MRVHEIGIARGGSSRAHKASQKEGQSEGEPRTAPQVSQHAVAERQAEMTERHRRDDHDLDSLTARRVDRVADERTGDVARVARIRCGEYDDAHAGPSLMRVATRKLGGGRHRIRPRLGHVRDSVRGSQAVWRSLATSSQALTAAIGSRRTRPYNSSTARVTPLISLSEYSSQSAEST